MLGATRSRSIQRVVMTKFVLCGAGWRADFFLRIAKALPAQFAISCIYTRREDKAQQLKSQGYNATTNLETALSYEHQAVIVARRQDGFFPLLKELAARGETIISETTFLSLTDEELNEAEQIKGFTLEQYWHNPLYASIKAVLPKIGKVTSVYLSALHNHHAASILRGIFGHLEIAHINRLLNQDTACLKTASRSGMERGRELQPYTRKITAVEFTTGEIFITDFSTNQYHSYILPSHIEIRGEQGVITERGVTYINEQGYPVELPFEFHNDAVKNNQRLSLSHVTAGSEVVFTNEFYPCDFNYDEIAIASMLKEFAEGHFEYTIKDGVADARIGKFF